MNTSLTYNSYHNLWEKTDPCKMATPTDPIAKWSMDHITLSGLYYQYLDYAMAYIWSKAPWSGIWQKKFCSYSKVCPCPMPNYQFLFPSVLQLVQQVTLFFRRGYRGTLTFCPMGSKNKITTRWSKDFRGFFCYVLLVIKRYDKIAYNFFLEIRNFTSKNKILLFPCKVVVHNY